MSESNSGIPTNTEDRLQKVSNAVEMLMQQGRDNSRKSFQVLRGRVDYYYRHVLKHPQKDPKASVLYLYQGNPHGSGDDLVALDKAHAYIFPDASEESILLVPDILQTVMGKSGFELPDDFTQRAQSVVDKIRLDVNEKRNLEASRINQKQPGFDVTLAIFKVIDKDVTSFIPVVLPTKPSN